MKNWFTIKRRKKKHLQDTRIFFRHKRLLWHVNFSDCEWEGDDGRDKLPKDGSNVSDDTEQGDLNSSETFNCLHHLTKYSESEDHGIEAIQVASDDKGSIVYHWFGWRPRDHSKQKCACVNKQSDEIQTVPGIPNVRKWVAWQKVSNKTKGHLPKNRASSTLLLLLALLGSVLYWAKQLSQCIDCRK